MMNRRSSRAACASRSSSIARSENGIKRGQGSGERLRFQLSPANAFERQRKRVEQSPCARIERDRSEQRLRRDQAVERLLKLFRFQVQQTMSLEERAAVRPADGREEVGAGSEPLAQTGSRQLG